MERRKRREFQKKCGEECSDDELDLTVSSRLREISADINATSPTQIEHERERRDSIKRERKSSADEFAEWNACLGDSPFAVGNGDLCVSETIPDDEMPPPKMVEIDGSDDDGNLESWWNNEGFKNEFISRSHTEISEVLLFLTRI